MKSYSESEVFSAREVSLLQVATALVESFPSTDYLRRPLRCHEVARAVGELLHLQVQDGFYGFVDHSWLWTSPLDTSRVVGRLGFPNILDPYSVGSLPMVRLVDGGHTGLPHVGWAYRPGTPGFDDRWVGVKDALLADVPNDVRTLIVRHFEAHGP